jgi:hypothetical protein
MPQNHTSVSSLTRIALLFSAIVVLFLALAAPSFAATSRKSTPAKKAHTVGSLPAQGMFDNCDLSSALTTCEQDLAQMQQSGLQVVVMSAQWDTMDEISSYAAYAQSIGMSVMWELDDPGYWGGAWIGSSAAADWSSFSSSCGCTGTSQILDYMIQWLSALPATYGYYAADDSTLEPGQAAGLKQYVDEIKSVDPSHMVMVGSSQGQGTTYYSSGATIGNEIYPETTTSLMPYNRNLAIWQTAQQSIVQDQRAATQEGASSAFILQAFSFGDNLSDGEAVGACTAAMSATQCSDRLQFPSASVQLELRNLALENAHPKLILWFTYSQASQGSHWADLTSVVKAQYPISASAARAESARKTAARKTAARKAAARKAAARRSSGHTLPV